MADKRKLRALVLGAFLAFGSMAGARVRPEDIENLLRTMRQTKIEYVVPAEPKKRLRLPGGGELDGG